MGVDATALPRTSTPRPGAGPWRHCLFEGWRLRLLPTVYEPAEDSSLLMRVLTEVPLPTQGPVVDVCAGSGVVGLSLAGRGAAVVATDSDPQAVATTAANAAAHGLAGRLQAVRTDLLRGVRGPLPLVVCNPPYLPTERFEGRSGAVAAWDGGTGGSVVVRRLLEQALPALADGGRLILILSSLTDLDLAAATPGRTVRRLGSVPTFFERIEAWEVR